MLSGALYCHNPFLSFVHPFIVATSEAQGLGLERERILSARNGDDKLKEVKAEAW